MMENGPGNGIVLNGFNATIAQSKVKLVLGKFYCVLYEWS